MFRTDTERGGSSEEDGGVVDRQALTGTVGSVDKNLGQVLMASVRDSSWGHRTQTCGQRFIELFLLWLPCVWNHEMKNACFSIARQSVSNSMECLV